jgi:hypothetical protein
MTDDPPLIHDVPFPNFLRIALAVIGLFIAVVPTYELWRGIWPLNLTTPFFAALLIAAWGGAYTALSTGLFAPQAKLTFQPGLLSVEEETPWGQRNRSFPVERLAAIAVQERSDSDGPSQWQVCVTTLAGENFYSRRFDTEVTAQTHAESFKAALGWHGA